MCRFIPSTLYPNRILNCDYDIEIFMIQIRVTIKTKTLDFLLNVQYRSKVSHHLKNTKNARK